MAGNGELPDWFVPRRGVLPYCKLCYKEATDAHLNSQQHLKFSKEQAEDPFVLAYMNWLGHHEFGQGQLSFDLSVLGAERDRKKLDFWLERWVEYYSYAQGLCGVEFIRYEEFLARPSQVVERIAKATGMTINAENVPVFEKTPEVPSGFSPDLIRMAQKVYAEIE